LERAQGLHSAVINRKICRSHTGVVSNPPCAHNNIVYHPVSFSMNVEGPSLEAKAVRVNILPERKMSTAKGNPRTADFWYESLLHPHLWNARVEGGPPQRQTSTLMDTKGTLQNKVLQLQFWAISVLHLNKLSSFGVS
jgi:hypothetical protein